MSRRAWACNFSSRRRRDRLMAPKAIIEVWRAADRHRQFGSIVQLCLLTGLRRGEAVNLSWSEILSDRILLLPGRTKTGGGPGNQAGAGVRC
jgi:integrase